MNSQKLTLFFLFLMHSILLQAEDAPVLNRFQASEIDGKVFLTWELAAGSVCDGIDIQRSSDGESFLQIGKIEGFCGSFSEPIRYDFIDTQPDKNKLLYYRLVMGRVYHSDTITIEILEINSGYLIRPSPISDYAEIYFDNKSNFEHQLSVFNLNGVHIKDYTTHQDFFRIEMHDALAGIYFFVISRENDPFKIKGSFIKVK